MASDPSPPAGPAAGPADGQNNERLGLLFIGIVLAEILSIAGLYWLGVHFR